MRFKKIALKIIAAGILLSILAIIICNKIIEDHAEAKLYNDVQSIPYNKVGLLLGTSKLGRTGQPNPYFMYRVQSAASLVKAGKIKYLVISGDNSRKDYNEPEDMRQELIKAGIDSTVIYLDYAGFRTFDSVVRLREIFGQDSVTFISQQFHNERAIYTASTFGIAAIGFNAPTVEGRWGLRVQAREKMARVKVFLDGWMGKRPKFGGEKIVIPG